MSDPQPATDRPEPRPLARATAGQLRRAGFVVPDVDDSATTGFEVLCGQGDEHSRLEHEAALARGDAFPPA